MFNPRGLEDGSHMVVGDCNGISTKERWDHETPIIVKVINDHIGSSKTVLDYGCGVGRIAKGILELNRDIDTLTGVDTSSEMQSVAKNYVLSDRFRTFHPSSFSDPVDFAYCVYVLQHVPAIDLRDVIRYLAARSETVFIINSVVRMAVHGEGFVHDGIDVISELSKVFSSISWGLPFSELINDYVMRKMFLEGNTMHYGILCKR